MSQDTQRQQRVLAEAIVGSLNPLVAAMSSIGISKDSVIQYEPPLDADHFPVIVHATPEKSARAILGLENPSRLDVHTGVRLTSPLRDVAAITA